jgi:hypothetical protein
MMNRDTVVGAAIFGIGWGWRQPWPIAGLG